MATVTVSIGAGTGHDENVTISSVGAGGPTYVVTLTATVPASVVVGDVFLDEGAGRWLVTGISGSDLTVFDSTNIGAAPDDTTAGQASCERYYNGSTPIVDWESELADADLYPGGAVDDGIGDLYNDGTNLNNNPTINATTLNSHKLTVPSGERHDGTAGTGARFVMSGNNAFTIQTTVTTVVEWLEINGNGNGANGFTLEAASGNQTVSHCIIHDKTWAFDSFGIKIAGGSTTVVIVNNVVYDIDTTSATANVTGITRDNSSATSVVVSNNTVHNITSSGGGTGPSKCFGLIDNANHKWQNNIATDPDGGDTSGAEVCYNLESFSNATVDHNLASDTTASGTGSLDSKTSANQFVSTTGGSEDLHLKTGADAIDAGTDLATTPTGVNIDIDGFDRDADVSRDPWDMGVHEFESLGGPFPHFLRRSMHGGMIEMGMK